MTKKALVCGAGGFIGGHLIERLKNEGYWVRGVDIKKQDFSLPSGDEFILGDLRDPNFCQRITSDIQFDELYQLAADMGGAGYIFTGDYDASIMHNSAIINLNLLEEAKNTSIKKVFYSSSACIYPKHIQMESHNLGLKEENAYPAAPDSEYGWEKLFSERLYSSYSRNYELEVRIARFHNIFGPEGPWRGGKEKAPAAICRKVAATPDGGTIEIWGDGKQTRTFLYIDECIEAIRRMMKSSFSGPLNIGSDEQMSINNLSRMVMEIARKNLNIRHIDGPLGVRSRSSDNALIEEKLNWRPTSKLEEGLKKTYSWIVKQVKQAGRSS